MSAFLELLDKSGGEYSRLLQWYGKGVKGMRDALAAVRVLCAVCCVHTHEGAVLTLSSFVRVSQYALEHVLQALIYWRMSVRPMLRRIVTVEDDKGEDDHEMHVAYK